MLKVTLALILVNALVVSCCFRCFEDYLDDDEDEDDDLDDYLFGDDDDDDNDDDDDDEIKSSKSPEITSTTTTPEVKTTTTTPEITTTTTTPEITTTFTPEITITTTTPELTTTTSTPEVKTTTTTPEITTTTTTPEITTTFTPEITTTTTTPEITSTTTIPDKNETSGTPFYNLSSSITYSVTSTTPVTTLLPDKNDTVPVPDKYILKVYNRTLSAIDTLFEIKNHQREFHPTCYYALKPYFDTLRNTLHVLMKIFVTACKQSLATVQLPDYTDSLPGNISNSRIKLENIELKGLRKVHILQVYADLCTYKTEVQISVPKLEISASYRLSGNIGNIPVYGAGNLTIHFDWLKIYDRSRIVCLKNKCWFNEDGTLSDVNLKRMTLNVTGIGYKDYDEKRISNEINRFIDDRMKHSKAELFQIIQCVLMNIKSNLLRYLSIVSILKMYKNILLMMPEHQLRIV